MLGHKEQLAQRHYRMQEEQLVEARAVGQKELPDEDQYRQEKKEKDEANEELIEGQIVEHEKQLVEDNCREHDE